MTSEEIINTLKSLKNYYNDKNEDSYVGFDNEDNEALDMAVKELEKQPCEDTISREAVEKITWEEPSYDDALNVLTEVRDKVRALPSVKPQRPSKNWIEWTDDYKDYVTCPSCGYGEEGEVLLKDKTPFCPICGEDLRGEK